MVRFLGQLSRDYELRLKHKRQIAMNLAYTEEFFNKCHDKGGRFCEGDGITGHYSFRGEELKPSLDPAYVSIHDLENNSVNIRSRNGGSQRLSGLDLIDHELGYGIIKNGDSNHLVDTRRALPGASEHVGYRAHQIGLEEELISNNSDGLLRLIHERTPDEVLSPGETPTRFQIPLFRPQPNYTLLYDTEDEYGVNLRIGVNPKSSSSKAKAATLIPFNSDLNDLYSSIAKDGHNSSLNKAASRATRGMAKDLIDSHRYDATGINSDTGLVVVRDGLVVPYDYYEDLQNYR